MLNITSNAYKKLDSVGDLMIDIKTTGCNGYSYQYIPMKELDSSKLDKLKAVKVSSNLYFSDKLHKLIWNKINTLDYKSEQFNSSFLLTSSITDSYCGCGHSFSVEEQTNE